MSGAIIPSAAAALGPSTELLQRAQQYLDASLAPSTRRAYANEWARFEAWAQAAGLEALPASPTTLALYLAREADERALAGVERALAAIVTVHRLRDAPSPKGTGVEQVLEGIRRTRRAPQRAKSAITLADLRLIVATLGLDGDGEPHPGDLRDRAALVLGFHAALRRSELLGLSPGDIHEVETPDGEGLTVRLGVTKTDQRGAGVVIAVGAFPEAPDVCPVAALRAWSAARAGVRGGGSTGPLFAKVCKLGWIDADARMSESTLVRRIKELAERAGLVGDFAGHSLRAGFVTTMLALGLPDREVMRVTRHRNVATLERYNRPILTFKDVPQRRMAAALSGAPAPKERP